jgi:hypothetical protein
MKKTWVLVVGVAIGLWALNLGVRDAYALRCGTRIIAVGDSKSEVLDRCGEPTSVNLLEQRWAIQYGSTYHQSTTHQERPYQWRASVTEEWVYDKGATRLVNYLIFENDRLIKIIPGGRGG